MGFELERVYCIITFLSKHAFRTQDLTILNVLVHFLHIPSCLKTFHSQFLCI